MEPTRPLAKRRLEQAIERFLIGPAPERSAPAVANLRRVLALISQEKRFVLFLFLREQTGFLTDYEIATAIKDRRSNVLRNLHAFVAEGLVVPRRDPDTKIPSFRLDPRILERLSDLFHPSSATAFDTAAEHELSTDEMGS
jgi:hypothetical protein